MGNLSSLRGGSKNRRLVRASGSGAHHYVHSGIDKIGQFEYRDWKVKITSRQLGIAIKRVYYTAQLTGPCAPFNHTLDRQTSKPLAIAAAKRFIDDWYVTNGEKWEERRRTQSRQQELRRIQQARAKHYY